MTADDKRTRLGPPSPAEHAAVAPAAPVAGRAAATAAAEAAVHSYLPGAPAEDPLIGHTLVDKYYVEKKLGEGGMGAVYLCQHVLLEKPVALKVLHGEFARKPELVQRFMQEARAASKIRHDNVIDISDFGATPEGVVFFAMELLRGHDLHTEIGQAKVAGTYVAWERSLSIFLQICSALAAAHKLGIIHRDLKPENVYVVERHGRNDWVKLLDFGIAKLTELGDGEKKLTRTGMLFGTPEYMAPEQARGEPVDHRVDVYAMGCILYQMVTSRVPFESDNFMGVLTMHLTSEPPAVSEAALAGSGAPREINAVIRRALAKDREQRFANVDELARAVRVASGMAADGADGSPFSAGMVTNVTTGKFVSAAGRSQTNLDDVAVPRKSKAPLVVGGGAVLLAAAAIGFMVLGGSKQEPAAMVDGGLVDAAGVQVAVPPTMTPDAGALQAQIDAALAVGGTDAGAVAGAAAAGVENGGTADAPTSGASSSDKTSKSSDRSGKNTKSRSDDNPGDKPADKPADDKTKPAKSPDPDDDLGPSLKTFP